LKLAIVLLVACANAVFSHKPAVSETLIRMPNGDENEIVSIDLQKRDGSEDIKLTAQLRFHMNEGRQMHVNGHRVPHNTVTQLQMHVTIVEIERGVRKEPRLAPVVFRVLVLEKEDANGGQQVVVEEEFVKVEENEVMQVDIKQVVWDGIHLLPKTASIAYKNSFIRRKPLAQDQHLFVPRLPEDDEVTKHHRHRPHPTRPHHGGHRHHHHHRGHWRIVCWFHRLPLFGKIAVLVVGVFTLLMVTLTMIVCCKKHCHKHHPRVITVQPMTDDSVVVGGCGEKEKFPYSAAEGEFHMEFNDCYVHVSDKKNLVEVD